MSPTDLVRVGATVERETADAIQRLADKAERSFAAEMRLALRHWVETRKAEEAA